MFGEWHQKTNKREDTNKYTLLAFKIIAIFHNTPLATFIKLLDRRTAVTHSWIAATSAKRCSSGGKTERSPPYSPDLVPAGVFIFICFVSNSVRIAATECQLNCNNNNNNNIREHVC
jgi:hypothetical protein